MYTLPTESVITICGLLRVEVFSVAVCVALIASWVSPPNPADAPVVALADVGWVLPAIVWTT